MISCSILTNIHPMLGVDWHMGTPGPPVVPVLMPHFVAQVLGGLPVVGSAKLVPTVLSHNFITLNQGTDIGMGIGHVATNILFPLYVITSSSASHFGSFSVLSGGQPTAAAMGVYVNSNLNCAQPLNMPTGLVIAPGCNMVGLSPADYLAGLAHMAVSMAISFIGGKIGSFLGGGAMKGIAALAGKFSVSAGLMAAFTLYGTKFGNKVASEIIGTPIGMFLSLPAGKLGDYINNEINDALMPNYSQGELLN